jgi:hypothetical protein
MWLRIVAIALVLVLSARSPEAQSSRHASELVGSWTGQLDGLADYPVQVSIDRLTAEGEVTGRYRFRNDAPLLFRERVRDTSFTFARGNSYFTFVLQPDGSLRATRQFPGGMNTILLQRVGLTPPPSSAALPAPGRMPPASCLPSSTPHWSKGLMPQKAPRQATLCSYSATSAPSASGVSAGSRIRRSAGRRGRRGAARGGDLGLRRRPAARHLGARLGLGPCRAQQRLGLGEALASRMRWLSAWAWSGFARPG